MASNFNLNISIATHAISSAPPAVEACLEWPQGNCAIDMDGTLSGQNHTRPIDKPLFLMLSQNHTFENDSTLESAWRNITQSGFMMHLQGAEHIAFADFKFSRIHRSFL